MRESFGTRLRRQRERQQVTLSSIAERTKIHQPLLEELERDDVSHWPSGIFRRAFLRSYAAAIGLKPDDVVREFLELYPDPFEAAAPAPSPPSFLGSLRKLVTKRDEVDQPIAPIAQTSSTPTPSVSPAPPPTREMFDVDLLAAGSLCTKLAQAAVGSNVNLLLHEAARILDAVGVVVWTWDPERHGLTAAMADGYSDRVLAHLPKVGRDADNATAAAFRSAETCAVTGGVRATSALAVPVMSPDGCVGVLAVELANGAEKLGSVRAVVMMIAAQLGRLVEPMRSLDLDHHEGSGLQPSSEATACA